MAPQPGWRSATVRYGPQAGNAGLQTGTAARQGRETANRSSPACRATGGRRRGQSPIHSSLRPTPKAPPRTHEHLLRHRLRPTAFHPALRPPRKLHEVLLRLPRRPGNLSRKRWIRTGGGGEEPDLSRPPPGDRGRRSEGAGGDPGGLPVRQPDPRRRGGARNPAGRLHREKWPGGVRLRVRRRVGEPHPFSQAGHREGAGPPPSRRSRARHRAAAHAAQARVGLSARPRAAPVHVRAAGAGHHPRGQGSGRGLRP